MMRTFLLVGVFLFVLPLRAQFLVLNGFNTSTIKEGPLPTDSLLRANLLQKLQQSCHEQGYWHAQLIQTPDTFALEVGPPSNWTQFELLNFPPLVLPPPTPSPTAPATAAATALAYWEEHGHPFAQVTLQEVVPTPDGLTARLVGDPGPEIRFDSIAIKGFDRFPKVALTYQLGLKPGMLYRESLLLELNDRLAQIPFLSSARTPGMLFGSDKSTLVLYLNKLKSNQLDGLVGINTNPGGTTRLTGQLDLKLLNALGKGESFDLHWQSPNPGWQSLLLEINTPYWFQSPIGLSAKANLFLQDSTFLNTRFALAATWIFAPGKVLKVGGERSASSLLNAEAATPGFANVEANLFTLGIESNSLRPYLLPKRGQRFELLLGTGSRTRNKNNYQTVTYTAQLIQHWALFSRHNLVFTTTSKALFADSLAVNELYRPGGINDQRGFNEQSLYASHLVQQRIEYRFFLDELTYALLSTDYTYLQNQATSPLAFQHLLGVATGLSFRTAAGQFNLLFALGRTDQQGFDFRAAKVHFGYTSSF